MLALEAYALRPECAGGFSPNFRGMGKSIAGGVCPAFTRNWSAKYPAAGVYVNRHTQALSIVRELIGGRNKESLFESRLMNERANLRFKSSVNKGRGNQC